MKLVHTSDWHFGKRLHEVDLVPLQARFCDWLVDLVKDENIDCVLISGDVYDRSNPKEDAVALLDNVLHRICSAGASIVMISGNHDSAERLNFGSQFMAHSGLHIRTERRTVADIGHPVTVTGRDGTELEILPLPYLDPERVAVKEDTARNHESVLRAVIAHQVSTLKDPSRTVAMAHAFVTGGASSDSERTLSIGGSGSVPADLFDPFGYVALGHLHRPQQMGDGRLVYSGTPMPYSFSEQHDKSVRLLAVDRGDIRSEVLPVDGYRPVATIEGSIAELLGSPEHAAHEDSFVRARVTDPSMTMGAMDRLRQRFPHVLELEWVALAEQRHADRDHVKGRGVADITRGYVNDTWPDNLDAFGTEFYEQGLEKILKGDEE